MSNDGSNIMIVMWYCNEIHLGCSSNRLQLACLKMTQIATLSPYQMTLGRLKIPSQWQDFLVLAKNNWLYSIDDIFG